MLGRPVQGLIISGELEKGMWMRSWKTNITGAP
jgi:hypothetical protein